MSGYSVSGGSARSWVPVRVADIGGWTDTWFARHGDILNIGVLCRYFGRRAPFRGVEVSVDAQKRQAGEALISIMAADPVFDVEIETASLLAGEFNRQNLLLATLSLLPLEKLTEFDLGIRIMSPIPPGASLGTSAAVSVGLITALRHISPDEAARLAWRAETEIMGGQSGTQDQWSAAYLPGIHRIAIPNYPKTHLRPIEITAATKQSLEEGLVTVFVGTHNSSDTHQMVIAELEREGNNSPRLQKLRDLAQPAEEALTAGNLAEFGQVMTANTAAQEALHPALIGAGHRLVIDLGRSADALGWKVNGAGAGGGSVTVLFAGRKEAAAFCDAAAPFFKTRGFLPFEHRLA
ncbi:MAG: GHMP kinase [Patescibacteria group bacterium]